MSSRLKGGEGPTDSHDVTRLRDSAGFTLIEVMIAALILIMGAGAAFALINSANRNVSMNQARSGATNLGRELTEFARTTDYDLLQPPSVVAALRKHTRIAGTLTGSAWTIERRKVTYAITTEVCTFDDPKDGFAAAAPPNVCPKAAAVPGVTSTDINGDDFRRVTYTMSWKVRGRAASTTQTALIVNPAGGLGPAIAKFTEPATQIVSATGNKLSWGGASTYELTTKSSAASVRWAVDDGTSAGDAAPGPTLWGFDWSLGPRVDPVVSWVRDGAYTIQAQAYDARGVPGEGKLITVYINRGAPEALKNVVGGWNETNNVIDMRWDRYDERDLQGYKVVRVLDNKTVCPAAGNELVATCTDSALPASFTTLVPLVYEVYAMDCTDLKNSTGCTRKGASVFLTVAKAAATAPDAPTGLSASVARREADAQLDAPGERPQRGSSSTASTGTRALR